MVPVTDARDRLLEGQCGIDSHDVKSNEARDTLPWADDLRAEDKTRIWRYLLNLPSGAPVSTITTHLFGVDPDEDETSYQREYRFVDRFVEEAPIFKIDRRQRYKHVEARPAAFHLTSPKQNSNTDAVGGLGDSGQSGESTDTGRRSAERSEALRGQRAEAARDSDACAGGSRPTDSPTIVEQSQEEVSVNQYPRDFARNFIASRGCDTMTESRARVLESQFVAYREQIDGRWNILKNIYDEHPEYLLVPYRTLYNSTQRVSDNWRRYHGAWKNATEEYSRAVQLTLTTDPKRFESLQEMADETSENLNRFMSWLRRRLADRCDDLGTEGHNLRECPDCEEYAERPDYISALEWTDAGRPHLHVIVFGVNWIAAQHEIADYWGKYQADIVDVRSVRRQPTREDGIDVDGHSMAWMTSGDESGAQKNEKAHMGKYLGEQMPSAESVADLRERVEDEDDDLWKTAMFWATGKRFWTCSEDLKLDDSDTEDDLADLPQYVFVGAAKDGDIPKHVWGSSVKLVASTSRGKDPPP